MSINAYEFKPVSSTLGVVTNKTDASFPSRVPTTTKPVVSADSPTGIIGCKGFKDLTIVPIGVGSATTFKIRVIGWKAVVAPSNVAPPSTIPLWVPTLLAEMTCTLGTTTGVAGTPVPVANYFASLITLTYGKGVLFQGAANFVCQIRVPVEGYEMCELVFDMNSSSTSANALVALHDTDRWVS